MASKESYKKHREKVLVKSKAYYQENKEKIKGRAKRWYFKNRERALAKQKIASKIYYQKNKHLKSARSKLRREKIRQTVFELFGKVECKKCGFSDIRALQIDHVNGGGRLESKILNSSLFKLMNFIKDDPTKYQILCANCNWIKRCENGEYKKI